MRICKKCNEEKPFEEFEVVNKEKGYRRWECKECVKLRSKKWRQKSKEWLQRQKREYYERHKEQEIRRAVEWNKTNSKRRQKIALDSYYRAQYEAIMAYGGYICACCGETEPMFMTLDHINNDGKEHRKLIGSAGGRKFYKWLRDNDYPEGLQVLCMNCSHGKYRNNGICPHKERPTTIPRGSRAKRSEAHSIPRG